MSIDTSDFVAVLAQNLPEDCTRDELVIMGSTFGDVYEVFLSPTPNVRSLKAPRDRFAAVKFRTSTAADKFVEKYNGFNLRGNILRAIISRVVEDPAVDSPPLKDLQAAAPKAPKPAKPVKKVPVISATTAPATNVAVPTTNHLGSVRSKRVLDPDNELVAEYVCTPSAPRNIGELLKGAALEDAVTALQATGLTVEEVLVDDPRLALFRMKLARDPDVYSRAVKAALDRKATLVPSPSMKVVRRCLAPASRSVVEVLMTSPENLLALKDELLQARARGHLEGPVLVLPADDVERVKGIPLNRENAISALCRVDARIIRAPKLAEDEDYLNMIDAHFDLEKDSLDEEQTGVDVAALCGSRKLALPILVLDEVRSGDNVGALLRSAFSLGVQSVLMTKTTMSGLGMRAMRVSMGAASHCTMAVCEDLPAVLKGLVKRGVDVIATSPTAKDGVLKALSHQKWALIVGNEDVGSSDATFEAASRTIKLVQAGGDSFSVSIAASVCLYMLREGALDADKEFVPDV